MSCSCESVTVARIVDLALTDRDPLRLPNLRPHLLSLIHIHPVPNHLHRITVVISAPSTGSRCQLEHLVASASEARRRLPVTVTLSVMKRAWVITPAISEARDMCLDLEDERSAVGYSIRRSEITYCCTPRRQLGRKRISPSDCDIR